MRTLLLYCCCLLLLSTLIGCGGDVPEKEPIRIGVDVFPGWAHVFIAQEKGFFVKHGVAVEIVLNEDYLAVQDLYATEQLDGAFMVYADAVYTHDQGLDTKVVYISDQSITGDVLVARESITNIQDLAGKTIGVEGINSFSHLFVLQVLEKNGMKEGDVFFKNVGAQELVAALEQNEVVAGHTYGPGKSAALEHGYVPLAYAGDVVGIITDVLAFHKKVIEERPEEVTAILRALFEAKDFQITHREEALQIMAQAIGDTAASVGIGIDAVEYAGLHDNVDYMRSEGSLAASHNIISDFYYTRGQIASTPDYNEIVESTFVNEIQKGLG